MPTGHRNFAILEKNAELIIEKSIKRGGGQWRLVWVLGERRGFIDVIPSVEQAPNQNSGILGSSPGSSS